MTEAKIKAINEVFQFTEVYEPTGEEIEMIRIDREDTERYNALHGIIEDDDLC